MAEELINLNSYYDKFDFDLYSKKKILREVSEAYFEKKALGNLPKWVTFDKYVQTLGFLIKEEGE